MAGRLARFDGGRNGAMLLVWSFIAVLVLALAAGVFSGFLPQGVAEAVGNLLDGRSSTVGDLAGAGVVGIVVAVGALLLALLGGFLGGASAQVPHRDRPLGLTENEPRGVARCVGASREGSAGRYKAATPWRRKEVALAGHVLFETGIRRLGSKENGFFYRYPGTGETVREERVLARIENLKVPPAWEDARIARSPSAKVQAVGYDSAGRLQYLYNARYREQKEREKFERVLRFADALPEMRRTTSDHLRRKQLGCEKVLAAMTRLMNAAYFRVGEERYAKT